MYIYNRRVCAQHGDVPHERGAHAAPVPRAAAPPAAAHAGRAPAAAHRAQHVRRGDQRCLT